MEIGEKGLENERFPIPTRKSILSNYNLMLSLSDALEFAKINIFGIGINHTSVLGIWFAWTLSVLTLIFVIAMRVPSSNETKEEHTYSCILSWSKV